MAKWSKYRLLRLLGLLAVLPLMCYGCMARPEMVEKPERLTLVFASNAQWQQQYSSPVFLTTDREIVASLDWPEYVKGETLNWIWVAPDGSVMARERRNMFRPRETVRFRFEEDSVANRQGKWKLVVESARGVLAEGTFILAEHRAQWMLLHPETSRDRTTAIIALCQQGAYGYLVKHFSVEFSGHEQSLVQNCLLHDMEQSSAVLAAALAEEPTREPLLALAYRGKKTLVERLVGGEADRKSNVAQLRQLSTPWDAYLLAPLLKSEHRELRLAGVRLIKAVGSPQAALVLEEMISEPDVDVRLEAATAVADIGGPAAVSVFQRWNKEENADIRKVIADFLQRQSAR